jgi:hypothetical protein
VYRQGEGPAVTDRPDNSANMSSTNESSHLGVINKLDKQATVELKEQATAAVPNTAASHGMPSVVHTIQQALKQKAAAALQRARDDIEKKQRNIAATPEKKESKKAAMKKETKQAANKKETEKTTNHKRTTSSTCRSPLPKRAHLDQEAGDPEDDQQNGDQEKGQPKGDQEDAQPKGDQEQYLPFPSKDDTCRSFSYLGKPIIIDTASKVFRTKKLKGTGTRCFSWGNSGDKKKFAWTKVHMYIAGTLA